MNKIILYVITFLLVYRPCSSQGYSHKKSDLLKETFYIYIPPEGSDKELNETIKSAFNKYWTFSKKEFYGVYKKDYKFTFDQWIRYSKVMTKAASSLRMSFPCKRCIRPDFFEMHFDDYRAGKKDTIGYDRSIDDYKNKTLVYIMAICRKVELMNEFTVGYPEVPLSLVSTNKKISQYTVYLSDNLFKYSNITLDNFKKYLPNCKVTTSKELVDLILNDKVPENSAQLVVVQQKEYTLLSIIDLKTGDVICSSYSQHLNSFKELNAKRIESLLSELK